MCAFQDLGCENMGRGWLSGQPKPHGNVVLKWEGRCMLLIENLLNTCPRSWLLKIKRIVYDISVKERFVWSKATLGFLEEAFWDVTQGKEAKSYWAVARWWDKVPFRFGWICWSLSSPLGFKFGWALVLPNNSKNLFIWEHMKIIPVDIRRKWCDQ